MSHAAACAGDACRAVRFAFGVTTAPSVGGGLAGLQRSDNIGETGD